jgi:predicted CXXCH cytochrome family protein
LKAKIQPPKIIMRNLYLNILVSATLVAGTVSATAGTISGTPHDLSGKGWGTTELCKYCHTPHLAQNVSGAPLWNHQSTVQSYTLYSSASFKGIAGQPGPQSKLCLSCHDGTVAIDSFANGGIIQAGSHTMTSTNLVGAGGSLASDHPIAFTYNGALATLDGHLTTPVSLNYVDAANQIPLYAGKMECASCHAVHDNTYGKFLRTANTGSALCLTCHQK